MFSYYCVLVTTTTQNIVGKKPCTCGYRDNTNQRATDYASLLSKKRKSVFPNNANTKTKICTLSKSTQDSSICACERKLMENIFSDTFQRQFDEIYIHDKIIPDKIYNVTIICYYNDGMDFEIISVSINSSVLRLI